MKKKGDVEYKEEAEKMLESLITQEPKTIGELTREMQKTFSLKIHYFTVERLLGELKKRGLVNIKKISRFKICQRY